MKLLLPFKKKFIANLLVLQISHEKKREIKRLGLLNNKNWYTKEKLDAMDYFTTGFYQKQ